MRRRGGLVGESCRCCGCTAASRNASDADKAPGEKRAAAAGTRLPPPVRVGTLGAHSRHHHDLSRAGTARRSASNARREPSLPIAADGPGPGPGHTSCTCALGRLQALPWAVRQVITTHSLELQNMELELQIQMRERLIFEQHELIKIQQKVLQVPLTNHCTRARTHTDTRTNTRAHAQSPFTDRACSRYAFRFVSQRRPLGPRPSAGSRPRHGPVVRVSQRIGHAARHRTPARQARRRARLPGVSRALAAAKASRRASARLRSLRPLVASHWRSRRPHAGHGKCRQLNILAVTKRRSSQATCTAQDEDNTGDLHVCLMQL